MEKRKTVTLDIEVCNALEKHREELFKKLMKDKNKSLFDMSVNDIARLFFNAGHWHGMKETLLNEEFGKLAKQIVEEIKKQKSE
jgi:hypothetical protein